MAENESSGMYGGAAPKAPKWKRELYILRRDGLRKWWRGLRALRRFHRSVNRMAKSEGGGHDA